MNFETVPRGFVTYSGVILDQKANVITYRRQRSTWKDRQWSDRTMGTSGEQSMIVTHRKMGKTNKTLTE